MNVASSSAQVTLSLVLRQIVWLNVPVVVKGFVKSR